jgi:hypothetical protein
MKRRGQARLVIRRIWPRSVVVLPNKYHRIGLYKQRSLKANLTMRVKRAISLEMAAQMDDSPLKRKEKAPASQTEVAQRFNGTLENSLCPIAKQLLLLLS